MSRILVTGASGQLGSYLLRELRQRDAAVIAWTGSQTGERFGYPLLPVDLRNGDVVVKAFCDARPDIVIHTAAMSAVADCVRDPAAAAAVNVQGTRLLAELADERKARLLNVSTDLVFDGERAPYRQDDGCAPLSEYGRSKAAAEPCALAAASSAVVRVSLLFGPSLGRRPTLFDRHRDAIIAGQALTLFDDEWRTPLDLPTATRALIGVAASDFRGILHIGGPERLSRFEMGERMARVLGRTARLDAISRNRDQGAEPRPRDVSLDSLRWRSLFPHEPWPTYEDAVRAMLELP
jgi:dTDP-4-dehydrorhamnose reductase